MSVLAKLNQARTMFHSSQIKKTGHNSFAGYDYFELGDFLVPALKIFDSLKLSAVVSFGVELATMTLTDLEDGTQFVITSPMSTAKLKACHEVQNLGAVQTYLRRYLWVAALEIVEHDAIDASDGVKEPDVTSILKNITRSNSLEILKANYEAAMQMLPPANHAAIKKATNVRKAELNDKAEEKLDRELNKVVNESKYQ